MSFLQDDFDKFKISHLYKKGIYLKYNPSLHEEDALWKFLKIKPLLDFYISINQNLKKISIMDIGSGSGKLFELFGQYFQFHGLSTLKISVDLSFSALKIQKKKKSFIYVNGDVINLPFKNKSVDLVFFIDVLEHVPFYLLSLSEIARVAKFLILKVPLEDNLYIKFKDFITKGQSRWERINKIGHINVFNINNLNSDVEKYCGKILLQFYTNQFEYLLSLDKKRPYLGKIERLLKHLAKFIYSISPRLCAKLFNDFVVMLIKCY